MLRIRYIFELNNMKIIVRVLLVSMTLLICQSTLTSQRVVKGLGVSENYVLEQVNRLRSIGCQCGNSYYKPVGPLSWNKLLEKTAMKHAIEMHKYDFFSHKSRKGEDVGDRFSLVGYKWQYAGENLAVGQKTFDEAFKDWVKSPTHCEMLMNPDMKEMSVSRYGKYWVQHFGKQLPPKTRRKNVRYKEG